MSILSKLSFDDLGPAKLWAQIDPDVRRLAARSVYDRDSDESAKQEANDALAETLRFRPLMVRRLPLDTRADYLARRVRADDELAETFLLALHLVNRRPMLKAFLDRLEIEHDDGVVEGGFDTRSLDPGALRSAVDALFRDFPADEVEIYLASLVAMDSGSWSGLIEILSSRT